MASNKISIAAMLLVFGVVLMLGSGNIKEVDAIEKICPLYCVNNLSYVICSSSGDTHLKLSCTNCCMAGPGCTLFFNDGTSQKC
ncbi:hypothetical protein RND81_01G212300 [Saponaria officinalis]|uniref:Uncharacterized protein n=1 Tax=Saponaria officinalis TaxID=3572 RepID=A0AAW1N8Z5_SAPOF